MGEARYYLKARFKSEKDAEAAEPLVEAFLKETGRAQTYWQNNRGKTPAQFWPKFKALFPTTTEYLGSLVGGDCNNALSGQISFGGWDGNIEDGVQVNGDVLQYAEDTWHMADWSPLCRFLEKKFGAVKAGWLSEEDASIADLIQL